MGFHKNQQLIIHLTHLLWDSVSINEQNNAQDNRIGKTKTNHLIPDMAGRRIHNSKNLKYTSEIQQILPLWCKHYISKR